MYVANDEKVKKFEKDGWNYDWNLCSKHTLSFLLYIYNLDIYKCLLMLFYNIRIWIKSITFDFWVDT